MSAARNLGSWAEDDDSDDGGQVAPAAPPGFEPPAGGAAAGGAAGGEGDAAADAAADAVAAKLEGASVATRPGELEDGVQDSAKEGTSVGAKAWTCKRNAAPRALREDAARSAVGWHAGGVPVMPLASCTAEDDAGGSVPPHTPLIKTQH